MLTTLEYAAAATFIAWAATVVRRHLKHPPRWREGLHGAEGRRRAVVGTLVAEGDAPERPHDGAAQAAFSVHDGFTTVLTARARQLRIRMADGQEVQLQGRVRVDRGTHRRGYGRLSEEGKAGWDSWLDRRIPWLSRAQPERRRAQLEAVDEGDRVMAVGRMVVSEKGHAYRGGERTLQLVPGGDDEALPITAGGRPWPWQPAATVAVVALLLIPMGLGLAARMVAPPVACAPDSLWRRDLVHQLTAMQAVVPGWGPASEATKHQQMADTADAFLRCRHADGTIAEADVRDEYRQRLHDDLGANDAPSTTAEAFAALQRQDFNAEWGYPHQ